MVPLVRGAGGSHQWLAAVLLGLCCLLPAGRLAAPGGDFPSRRAGRGLPRGGRGQPGGAEGGHGRAQVGAGGGLRGGLRAGGC